MQTVPHDLGFILCPSTPCGLSSCSRNSPHFHCRYCTYGTSQIANAIAHGRLCTDLPQKEYQISAEALYQTAQPFTYYPPVTQSNSASSKIITAQQSTMFSFVLPSQNQFGGLYGAQTVFPNPNLFSPSGFNSYGMDASWVTQSRLLPSSTQSVSSNDVANPSNGCPINSNSADKNATKESQTQNWAIPSTSPGQQKYLDPTASCSISLLFLEGNKDSDECIDVDDIYLTPKGKETAESCLELANKAEEKAACFLEDFNAQEKTAVSLEVFAPTEKVVSSLQDLTSKRDSRQHSEDSPDDDEILDVCIQQLTPKRKESSDSIRSVTPKDITNCLNVPPNESDAINLLACGKSPKYLTPTNLVSEDNLNVEECKISEFFEPRTNSSNGSDIVVEESDSMSEAEPPICPCIVCDATPTINAFTPITELTPLASASRTPIFDKLRKILGVTALTESSICSRCLNLINGIDQLERRLSLAMVEIREIHNARKVNAECQTMSPNEHFICKKCEKGFVSAANLEKHQKKHTSSYSYCCEYCGVGFSCVKKLTDHIDLHISESDNLRFQCEICGKELQDKTVLTNHIRRHQKLEQYTCQVCKEKFNYKLLLKVHYKTHCKDDYVCHHCGIQISNVTNLLIHIQKCQGILDYKCDQCDEKFAVKSLLNKHIAMEHNLIFKFHCKHCQKGFWKESDLKGHLVTHTTGKPFKCNLCENSYKNKRDLSHHVRIHDTDQTCRYCGKKFIRSEALTDHLNSHTGNKPYQCKKCNKKFANRINYHQHLRRHDENFKRQDENFKRQDENKKRKEYPCSVCGMKLAFKNSLVKHWKRKHKKEIFPESRGVD